jgi:hypothetical protein
MISHKLKSGKPIDMLSHMKAYIIKNYGKKKDNKI